MHILGMHVLDVTIIVAYFAAMIGIGKFLQKRMHSTEDYFMGGRRMGRLYQFFLNFGASTDASQAAAVSREIYRQGIAGMWIQYLVLFLTPFYWFTAMLFRRARLVTIGDFFTERFESKFLGGAFAVFAIFLALFGTAVGYLVSAKTFMALTPKPASAYTAAEKRSVESYHEYRELKALYSEGKLPQEQRARYQELRSLDDRGELVAFISHVKPVYFYFAYGTIVCVYVLLGGLTAAALTDVIQGALMIFFSCLLIPFGLIKIGGFSGLHAAVPEHMFWLFGTEALSEYAWYTIAAMSFANLVSITAVATGMQVSGSATNENTARFGMIGGMMFKRVMMIFWALAGLLAIGLYTGKLSDPDLIWGYMTQQLLWPGFIGIMMVGILAANMSTLDVQSVSLAALFVNQVYKPLVPNRSEKHYLGVGRLVVFLTIFGGIGMALYVKNLLELFKYFISMPAIFGAAIWLGFTWRRLSTTAVTIQIFVSFLIMAIIPNVFTAWEVTRSHPPFLAHTQERQIVIHTKALQTDVDAGLAREVGERIAKTRVIPPYPIFFDKVARENPEDPNSRLIGIGRFNAELWVLSWFGLDFSGWNKAQLEAARFAFDALFPLLCLIVLSYFTRPVSRKTLDYFFAKVHTPIQPTPEEDRRLVLENAAHMHHLEARKLFPRTHWEFHKPLKMDYLGFFGTWGLVGLVILLLWIVVNLGA
ncbi:MAG: sodium:solute symporter family protein [candidate division KSB1 bacterium]|nr:sodium:solute symporter family protein [candidate division KSB1 bacterium]MDZ7276224.1 sodium:solute symporter family protein [candidate division KSB1 bacterium]MDZ7287970.1 sodium:solute symporter family protein [candidate division KSB1 bacterium]MDZ7300017.1 sodium:solute symporter family protein [candidate division KSB1 bacterium]MDZ7308562.1 sodium:solute symporter family protein [candidate division KSB1 bacterium]